MLTYHAIHLQIHFALSSPVFSRTDMAMDSEHFYDSVLFNNSEEIKEVNKLLSWWNW